MEDEMGGWNLLEKELSLCFLLTYLHPSLFGAPAEISISLCNNWKRGRWVKIPTRSIPPYSHVLNLLCHAKLSNCSFLGSLLNVGQEGISLLCGCALTLQPADIFWTFHLTFLWRSWWEHLCQLVFLPRCTSEICCCYYQVKIFFSPSAHILKSTQIQSDFLFCCTKFFILHLLTHVIIFFNI